MSTNVLNNLKKQPVLKTIDISKLINNDPAAVKLFARKTTMWIYITTLSYVQNKGDAEENVENTLISPLSELKNLKN